MFALQKKKDDDFNARQIGIALLPAASNKTFYMPLIHSNGNGKAEDSSEDEAG
jgi:hypothetical protein